MSSSLAAVDSLAADAARDVPRSLDRVVALRRARRDHHGPGLNKGRNASLECRRGCWRKCVTLWHSCRQCWLLATRPSGGPGQNATRRSTGERDAASGSISLRARATNRVVGISRRIPRWTSSVVRLRDHATRSAMRLSSRTCTHGLRAPAVCRQSPYETAFTSTNSLTRTNGRSIYIASNCNVSRRGSPAKPRSASASVDFLGIRRLLVCSSSSRLACIVNSPSTGLVGRSPGVPASELP